MDLKQRVRKSCSPVPLRPLCQLRAVPIQPRRQRKGGKAGASCSNPSVRASLIGLPCTHSTTSPSRCLLFPLGKSNWRARASPSAVAAAAAPRPACAHCTAPRRGAGPPWAAGQAEAAPNAPCRGGQREGRPSLPRYLSGPSLLSSPAPLRGGRSPQPPLWPRNGGSACSALHSPPRSAHTGAWAASRPRGAAPPPLCSALLRSPPERRGRGVRSLRTGARGRGEEEIPAEPRRSCCGAGRHRRCSLGTPLSLRREAGRRAGRGSRARLSSFPGGMGLVRRWL